MSIEGPATHGMQAAVALGLDRDGGEAQLSDEFIAQVLEAVRPTAAMAAGTLGMSWKCTTPSSSSGW